jgi:hypothetical protein
MTWQQFAVFAVVGLPILWWVTRKPKPWFDGVGRPAAIRLLSKAAVIREKVR